MSKPAFLAIACMVVICSLNSFAADAKPASFADLPAEAQKAITAAIERDVAQRSPGTIQNFTLTASDGANDADFGISVAIDDNTVVVGASKYFNDWVGEAYVFVKPGSSWKNMTQTAILQASDGADLNSFGTSVAISGNTIVVGAPTATVNGNLGQGKAYIFVKPSNGWKSMTETAILLASDGAPEAGFGNSVSVSGVTVVVGAYAPGSSPGSAYVFVQPPGGWVNMTETAELTASDGIDNAEFGWSVFSIGGTVIVGAPNHNGGVGSAYVFVEPSSGWANMTETAELTASDRAISNFGWSVSLTGNTAVVGAPYDGRGAAYVFLEPQGGWSNMTETAELATPTGNEFGWSVAQIENAIIGGAPFTNPAHQGAAYVFIKPSGGWKSTSKPNVTLAIPFTYGFDNFGASVAVSGKTAVVGAYTAPSSPPCKPVCQVGPGEAFVFVEQ